MKAHRMRGEEVIKTVVANLEALASSASLNRQQARRLKVAIFAAVGEHLDDPEGLKLALDRRLKGFRLSPEFQRQISDLVSTEVENLRSEAGGSASKAAE